MAGIWTSRKTRSGFSLRIVATASAPLLHSATISTSGSCLSIRRMNLRASSSSSAMTARILGEVIRAERNLYGDGKSLRSSVSHLERKIGAIETFKACPDVTKTYAVSFQAMARCSQARPGIFYFKPKRIISPINGDFDPARRGVRSYCVLDGVLDHRLKDKMRHLSRKQRWFDVKFDSQPIAETDLFYFEIAANKIRFFL